VKISRILWIFVWPQKFNLKNLILENFRLYGTEFELKILRGILERPKFSGLKFLRPDKVCKILKNFHS